MPEFLLAHVLPSWYYDVYPMIMARKVLGIECKLFPLIHKLNKGYYDKVNLASPARLSKTACQFIRTMLLAVASVQAQSFLMHLGYDIGHLLDRTTTFILVEQFSSGRGCAD